MADQVTAVSANSAWDYKDLLSKLEGASLPILEKAAMQVINSTFDWVQESVAKSNNKIENAATIFLPSIRAYALQLADKIAAASVPENNQVVADAMDQAKSAAAVDVGQAPLQAVASNDQIQPLPTA